MRCQLKGTMFPLTIAVFLCLLIVAAGVMETMRIHTLVSTVKSSYESIVYDLTLDNNENLYAGLRDGYAGAYTYDELSDEWNEFYDTNYEMIACDLSQELGLISESGGFRKDVDGAPIYRIRDIESHVTNTALAPVDQDGTFTVVHSFALEIPLTGLWRALGPIDLTIEVEAKALALF